MGFRSTFSTSDYPIAWPVWFRNKYAETIQFLPEGPLHSIREAKAYGVWEELPKDIQRAIAWRKTNGMKFILVYLHECGGVTRCQIEENTIRWSEPETWKVTDQITHSYCYECSDVAAEPLPEPDA